MKTMMSIVFVFFSLNLYGMQQVQFSSDEAKNQGKYKALRLFSPAPEDGKDLSEEINCILVRNPKAALQLKQDFLIMLNEVILLEINRFGELAPILKCNHSDQSSFYQKYENFGLFLITQILNLGYKKTDFLNKLHDNRSNLLYCWLEVNLLSRYDNYFFARPIFEGQASDFDQKEFVNKLYALLLPAFCLALSNKMGLPVQN